jgi:BolA protein
MQNHETLVQACGIAHTPSKRKTIDPIVAITQTEIMRTADIITEKLTKAFAPQSLAVEDESHLHVGHAGHRPEGQTHYRVYIVSDAFAGKSRVERHRMINAALAAELAGSVHALALHATAPDEPQPKRQ